MKLILACFFAFSIFLNAFGMVSDLDLAINENIERYEPAYTYGFKTRVSYHFTDFVYRIRLKNTVDIKPSPWAKLEVKFLGYTDENTQIEIVEEEYIDTYKAKKYYEIGNAMINGIPQESKEVDQNKINLDSILYTASTEPIASRVVATVSLSELLQYIQSTDGKPMEIEVQSKGLLNDAKVLLFLAAYNTELAVKVKDSGYFFNSYEDAPVYLISIGSHHVK